jgi:hypothetical protein
MHYLGWNSVIRSRTAVQPINRADEAGSKGSACRPVISRPIKLSSMRMPNMSSILLRSVFFILRQYHLSGAKTRQPGALVVCCRIMGIIAGRKGCCPNGACCNRVEIACKKRRDRIAWGKRRVVVDQDVMQA